jgi:hypothetical protein
MQIFARRGCQINPWWRTGFLFLVVLLAGAVLAQPLRFQQIVGHDPGERITLHRDMVHYLTTLASQSDRVQVVPQGRSWEGRELLLAVVSDPSNLARLNSIQKNAAKLADPRTLPPAAAEEIIRQQPAVVWLGGSIHGFELSGAEALLKLLEHLSTRDDSLTRAVLKNLVILIDPMLNPDGRDAFALTNIQNSGHRPNPYREDWNNDFTFWEALKFRTGHYYFDTNRDWFAQTQEETRNRVPTFLRWHPQVSIDLHEMGSDVEFYFDPATEPYGPYFPPFARKWFERFGEAYAASFDTAGFEYMTRERYNFFYPGYTTSFNSYLGAVGMLYEQGSTRGLAIERPDGTVRTLQDALTQHYTAAWTALVTAARNRESLLRDFYNAKREDLNLAQKGYRYYFLPKQEHADLLRVLIETLLRDGIEVYQTVRPLRLKTARNERGKMVNNISIPAGSYLIDAYQPLSRLVRVLLEPEVPLPDAFLKEARKRVERGENPRFYDITAWSLPLLFNLKCYATRTLPELPKQKIKAPEQTLRAPEQATYAYAVDGHQVYALSVLYDLKAAGYRASVLLKPTRIAGHKLGSGTVIFRVGQNPPSLHNALRRVARKWKVEVLPLNTGLSEEGYPALGSSDAITVKMPEIALVAENPVRGYSFGWAWYTLDRQYGIPVTVLRASSLSRTRLSRFNVIVLPDCSPEEFARLLGEAGKNRLSAWVRSGGTLVTIGNAVEFARKELKLVDIRNWYETKEGKNQPHFRVPGSILAVQLDPEYWLAAGYDVADIPFLVTSDRIYLPSEKPPSPRRRYVGVYAPAKKLRISGHIWEESLQRLPGTLCVYEQRVNRGRVICFVEDPNFRAYHRGLNRLFLNAVLLGPSAP